MCLLNVKIDPDYTIKGTVSECFAHYFGDRTRIIQWMESNGGDWTRFNATIGHEYQQSIAFIATTPNQPFICSINVTKLGKLYTYVWHSPIEG